MLGGTFLLTKLLMPALEEAATRHGSGGSTEKAEGVAPGGGGRVINVSSGGMYTVSGEGISKDMDSRRVDPYDAAVM